jgi:class 3 adenylate cyclase
MCDGFSAAELIAMVNAYFEQVVGAIYARGGEVLKSIGDGVLAVFPVQKFSGAPAACRAAIEAVGESRARLATLNVDRQGRGLDPLADGVAQSWPRQ